MGIVESLGVEPGITAIIGSGGKTTLMERLARELAGTAQRGHGGRLPDTPGTDGISGTTRTARELTRVAASRAGALDSTGCEPSPTSASSRTVVLATTTRVLPPVDFPLLANLSAAEVATCLPTVGVAYVGSVRETKGVRKLGAPLWRSAPNVTTSLDRDAPVSTSASPEESREDVVASIEQLAHLATYTLVEADGSHHLPLKAHASWEPVVPAGAHTILVVGAFGFGQPVEKVVHRSELFCEHTGSSPADLATPELVAQEIASEVQEERISFDTVLVTGRGSARDTAIRIFAKALRANGISASVHVA